MPELPEAETIRRQLAPQVEGQHITSVNLGHESMLHCPGSMQFRRRLKGRRILSVGRRGKAVIFNLDDCSTLIIRLGMSGTLKLLPADTPFDKHTHLRLGLGKKGELRLRDPRRFGCIALRKGADCETFPEFTGYGPEPLSDEFSSDYLAKKLAGRKAKIGVLLMDQRIVAGIGKIYADEILFRANVRPGRAAGRLSKKEITDIVSVAKEVLEEAIGDRGTTAEDSVYIDSYGLPGGFRPSTYQRTGQPCPRCGDPIRRTRLNDGRGMHWCAECQK